MDSMEVILAQCVEKFNKNVSLSTRVDLLGPPAAGKSTLCHEVLKKIRSESNLQWVDIQEAKRLATHHVIQNVIPRIPIQQRVTQFIRRKIPLKDLYDADNHPACYSGASIEKFKERLMEAFSELHHSFLEALAEQWHDPDTTIPPRFERFNQVRIWIRELLFLATFVGDARILADNARLTKGMAELLSNRSIHNADQIVAGYCRSSLAPKGIIHISGKPETILTRSRQRREQTGETNPGHESRSPAEISHYTDTRNSVNKLAVDFFKKENIAILQLTAEADMQTNRNLAIDFLNQFVK